MTSLSRAHARSPIRVASIRAAWAVAAILGLSGLAHADVFLEGVEIDRDRYPSTGAIRLFVDAVSATGETIPTDTVELPTVRLTIDGKQVPLTAPATVSRFADHYGASVAIVLPAHRDYQEGADIDEVTTSFDEALGGMKAFIQQLGSKDRVGVFCYSEQDTLRLVHPIKSASPQFANEVYDQARKTCRLQTLEKNDDEKGGGGSSKGAPELFAWLESGLKPDGVIRKELDGQKGTQRSIVLVMSDGIDVNAKTKGGRDTINRHIEAIDTESKSPPPFELWLIGFDGLEGTFFPSLATLASRTGGVWRPVNEPEDIEKAWREMAARLAGQLIFDVQLGDFEASDKAQPVALSFGAGGVTYETNTYNVRLPARSTDWMGIAKWVGIGLGGLFLVVLLFILLLNRVRNPRPKSVVIQQQEVVHDPGGPARGRLLLTKGPGAGETFFLTEEVTTIGRIDGNHIVIDDVSVSKRHAGIRVKDLRFELADLGSANGVMVNGRQITKQFLRDGDQIRVGDTEMTFHLK